MTNQESKLWAHKAQYVYWQLFGNAIKTWKTYKLCLDLAYIIELAK